MHHFSSGILKHFLVLVLFALYMGAPTSASAQKTIEDVITEMIADVSEANMLEHLKTLENAGGTRSRLAFSPGKDSAAVFIKGVLDGIPGLKSVEFDTFYIARAVAPFNTKPQVNIVAMIEGTVFPDEYYVIGAHYDATADRDPNWNNGADWLNIQAPGADDNGTGVVALLEMARIFTDPQFDFTPERTIKLVFFGAEERGIVHLGTRNVSGGPVDNHYGSIHFAKQARARNDKLIGMISVDMIGYNNNFDYTAMVKVNNEVSGASAALGAKLVEANNFFTIGLMTNAFPFANGAYSDHESFADEGFPAILVIENAAPWNTNQYYQANPYYHKQTDTWDRVNMRLVRKVTQMNLAAIASYVGTVTSIDREPFEIAQEIELEQNYPNPFNPTTTIRYTMQESGPVSLRVYDVLGNEVTTLVNQTQAAGTYMVNFDASSVNRNLASGIYLYRLQTERSSLVRKMMLVK
jgi:hypothetical protein